MGDTGKLFALVAQRGEDALFRCRERGGRRSGHPGAPALDPRCAQLELERKIRSLAHDRHAHARRRGWEVSESAANDRAERGESVGEPKAREACGGERPARGNLLLDDL